VALDRSEHTIGGVSTARFEQGQEPSLFGKLVIVDERNKIARGICDGPVSRQGDVLLTLHAVRDSNRRVCCKTQYQSFSRSLTIIVSDDNGKGKQSVSFLLLKCLQKTLQ
jgi:hypothetical protein